MKKFSAKQQYLRRITSAIDIPSVVLLTAFVSIFAVFIAVTAQNQPVVHANQSADSGNSGVGIGSLDYAAPYSAGKYVCKGTTIYQEAADGSTNKIADCADTKEVCYAVDDQIDSKTGAKCLDPGQSINSCSVSTTNSSIAQCQFTRGSDTANYQSPILLNDIDEVARNTGVPNVLLASIVKIESTVPNTYSITDYTDSDMHEIDSANPAIDFPTVDEKIGNTQKAICPRNATEWGLGIMQVQPASDLKIPNAPGAVYSDSQILQKGVDYLNKYYTDRYNNVSVAGLKLKDYCDPKTSLYLGAGLLQSKGISLTVPTDSSQLPAYIIAVANAYNGYSSTRGPGDTYYDSLFSSLSNCKPTDTSQSTATTQCTTAGSLGPKKPFNAATARQDLIDTFGVTMDGFDTQHMQWAWDKLWDISGTNMIHFLKDPITDALGNPVAPTHITAITGSTSWYNGGRSISLGNFSSEQQFDVFMLHEMGHLVQSASSSQEHDEADFQKALADEGGITGYSRNPCTFTTPQGTIVYPQTVYEDYAEMVTYYLNPTAPQQSCNSSGDNPYKSGKYPEHLAVVKQVLGAYGPY